ncbi:hypothetical protein V8G61_09820 [Gaetbulibacter sp. M240]|uniref:hypothetical protein n=1 Tax=Gaetbulibacter sp. M240 TaxID=3126511 RepID=UPI00374EBB28
MLQKIIKIVAFALAILGAILALMIMGADEGTEGNLVSNMLYVSYVVLAIVLTLVVIFVVKGLFSGNIKKTLLTVGAFLLIVLISYSVSSGTDLDLTKFTAKGQDVSEQASRYVGTGLYTFYVLAVIAILSMLLSSVKKIFNK